VLSRPVRTKPISTATDLGSKRNGHGLRSGK
jgi:hypothetical protein